MNKIKTSASDTLMNLKINNLPFFHRRESLCKHISLRYGSKLKYNFRIYHLFSQLFLQKSHFLGKYINHSLITEQGSHSVSYKNFTEYSVDFAKQP